jgi:hypothetical protein
MWALILGDETIGCATCQLDAEVERLLDDHRRLSRDRRFVINTLDELHGRIGFTRVVCSDDKGAAKLGIEWAQSRDIPVIVVKSRRWLFRRDALGQRNDRMLGRTDIDTCIGFGHGAETTRALQEAKRRGLEALHFEMELQTQ